MISYILVKIESQNKSAMKKLATYVALLLIGISLNLNSVYAGSSFSVLTNDEIKESDKMEQNTTNENFKGLKLYPNPSSNYFYLSSESGMTVRRIAIADMLGNTVWELWVNDIEPIYKIQVPVADLKNGIYFVEIESNNQRITRKISKE